MNDAFGTLLKWLWFARASAVYIWPSASPHSGQSTQQSVQRLKALLRWFPNVVLDDTR